MIKKAVIAAFAAVISIGGVVAVAFEVDSYFAKQDEFEYAVESITKRLDYREARELEREIQRLSTRGNLTPDEAKYLRYLQEQLKALYRRAEERG